MNILLTGGAGFIGSNIADAYAKIGHKVIVIDNLKTGLKKNIRGKCEFINADIFNDDLDELLSDCKIDVINHHAANIDLRKSVSDPIYDAKINIYGSLNLLEFAKKRNIKKIIYASTGGSVYGEQQYFPADEKHPLNPQTPYAISKLAVEHYLHFYKKFYGIEYVILRYSNVYGERQGVTGEAGVISIFIRTILSGRQPQIFGDGLNTRDFVYVRDVAEANIKALDFKGSTTLNISSGKETSIIDVYDIIRFNLNSDINKTHKDPIEGEQSRSVLSNSAAREILGWEPGFSLNEGLFNTCEWFRNNVQ
jgi:UDP-glucose 4-epimerase